MPEKSICTEECIQRVEDAIAAIKNGDGVIVMDDESRENEGDLIFSAAHLTNEQMALLIRECSGIVCVVITEERREKLNIPMMVSNNRSPFHTAFTVSIEASEGVTTGVSAADRVTTVKAACKKDSTESDICCPGHVFPLVARNGGVLERPGHTEATMDLMLLSKLSPFGVLCEITNPDGTMATGKDIDNFSKKHSMPIVHIPDIISYRQMLEHGDLKHHSEKSA
ncbi:MAG: 3,4-dihydroxy-2-butanone-4-phosphate synthase [Deltaproteobacteria bacterium]|nr:3,4-dihydroxy-2-butanone-4-phosphate synthase [Deltaproteobacteria bacterium]